ncbi:cryptochrome/photolyase family protein [Arundinibacter roseus]|uniref:Cryptochrome/photolyase family protein n=1 Tax=Arundinibacter roseus TaxID=2070510 RepID=A0A4R4KAQ8_9BACT|nr:cryptochrome/photolyase family protein [Arundinibacter roseus]TDB63491.1 cryptochrome/photolyase family protein [Arundinibacter roseus]
MPTLRLLLGDQLNSEHSWFKKPDSDTTYLMMEMRQETDYAVHHIQKIVAFFAAMRVFSEYLQQNGHQVIYYTLDDPGNQQELAENISEIIHTGDFTHFDYQLPDEWRLDGQLKTLCADLYEAGITSEAWDTEHFLSSRSDLKAHFKGRKTFVMESFYRMMRQKYSILMNGKEPLTGQWNYDASNRQPFPAGHQSPEPLLFITDVRPLLNLIRQAKIQTVGNLADPEHFGWPVSRADGLRLLNYFVENLLVHFGDFQDAMTPHAWALYHSRLSFVLNVKLVHPLEVIETVVDYWKKNQESVHISQVEGFVRQILGWREYMRGMYWTHMPNFATMNYFEHSRPLPDWFWTGNTRMNCLRHSIGQSLDYAYAHHIQRLMITGNFALLAGINPDDVDAWYLGIYIDAIEWVEITNTRGMSQFADGGLIGTKPYVSSANYIDKMSSYCDGCFYDKKKKIGEKACPFNSLYWHFYNRHEALLQKNPRIGMVYPTWKRMKEADREGIIKQAELYLDQINDL